MIERNIGDDTDPRIDNVGCVEAPAHPNFKDCDIQLAGCEMLEGHGGQHFEKAGMPGQFATFDEALGGALDHVVQQSELFVVDVFAVDADALVNPHEMRRSVQPGAQAGCLQN